MLRELRSLQSKVQLDSGGGPELNNSTKHRAPFESRRLSFLHHDPSRLETGDSPIAFHRLNYASPTSLDVQTSPQSLDITPFKTRFLRSSDILPSQIIKRCADLFFSQVESTVPIITEDAVRHAVAASAGTDEKGEEAYCFLCAFCAFVMLQTGGPDDATGTLIIDDIPQNTTSYGQVLLREALSARSHLDIVAVPTMRAVILTFFIYGCHSALGKHRQAWYFLREATTLYTSATLDAGEDILDDGYSRLYWLLLISERSVTTPSQEPNDTDSRC